MSSIKELQRDIQRELPGAETKLRRPRNPDGTWWLDASYSDHTVTVQWSSRHGFGVSASALDEGYGEGPEEVFDDLAAATHRVLELLRTRGHTLPPHDVMLRELRAMVGFTQAELAARLGVQQAAVSRLERRTDITLGSLKRYVEALGGELEINVRTAAGERVRLLDPEP